jgi:hypothetical protein
MDYSNPSNPVRVRQLLRAARLTQLGAAAELRVGEATLRRWCAGEEDPPRMAILALERLVDMEREIRQDVARANRLVDLQTGL